MMFYTDKELTKTLPVPDRITVLWELPLGERVDTFTLNQARFIMLFLVIHCIMTILGLMMAL